jgi:hypothetical protein
METRLCGLLRKLDLYRSGNESRFTPEFRVETDGFAASLTVVQPLRLRFRADVS